MGQAHPGVVDETCCEWMTFTMRKRCKHIQNLSHTQVRVMICDQMRDIEKNVRATWCSVFTISLAKLSPRDHLSDRFSCKNDPLACSGSRACPFAQDVSRIVPRDS